MAIHLPGGRSITRITAGAVVVASAAAFVTFAAAFPSETPQQEPDPISEVAGVQVTADPAPAPPEASIEPATSIPEGPVNAQVDNSPLPIDIVLPELAAEGDPDPPPPPPPPPVSPAFLELETSLNTIAANYWVDGFFAYAVTDLQTGHTIGVNHLRPQLSGCVANFFVLVSAMQDVQAGVRPLSQVDDLIDATIWSSNATTARELYRITGNGDPVAGVAKAAAIPNDQLGLDAIIMDHPPAFGFESRGIDANNWVTAESVNASMAALYRRELLDETHTAHLMDAMVNVKPGLNYLAAATPGGIVSHKNGFFPMIGGGYVDNDAGIVRFERNGQEYAYAITFLSSHVATKYNDIPLAQQLVTATWDYFDATYK